MSGRRILSDLQLEEMRRLREKGRGPAFIAEHFTRAGNAHQCRLDSVAMSAPRL